MDKIEKKLKLISYIALIFIAIIFTLYFWTFPPSLEFSRDRETWAGFGDYIGGILSPILAFIALIALLYSIYIQSVELKHSASQLENSAKALTQQNELIKKQRTEASFFQLLNLYNEIVQQFYINYEDANYRFTEARNRQCIDYLAMQLKIQRDKSQSKLGNVDRQKLLNEAYAEFNLSHGSLLGHYFRTIIVILEFIDKSELSVNERNLYVDILRSQLSRNELMLLFYYVLYVLSRCKSNEAEIVKLTIKYRLFNHSEFSQVLIVPDEDVKLMNIAITAIN